MTFNMKSMPGSIKKGTWIVPFIAAVLAMIVLNGEVSAETVELDENTFFKSLVRYTDIWEDETGETTIDDVSAHDDGRHWVRPKGDTINLGYTRSVFWVRTVLVNRANKPMKFFVEIGYPFLDHVHVFVKKEKGQEQWIMGDKYPFTQRPIDEPGYAWPIEMTSGETVSVFARIKTTSSMQVPIALYSPGFFFEEKQRTMLFQGLYYGSMVIMVLYNFFLFLSVRESDYLYYALYVLSQCLFFVSFNGLSFKYFWPQATDWNDGVVVVSLAAMIFSGNLSAIRFMNLTKNSGRTYAVFLMLALAAVVLMLLSPWTPYRLGVATAMLLGVVSFLFGIPAVLVRWYKGFPPGRFFAFGWLSLACGAFVLVLNKTGFVPRNFLTEHAAQIGSVGQVMLLSFALADRLNMEKKEKIEAQITALEEERNARKANENALLNERLAREAKEESYLIQRKAAETLEQEVMERTGQLNETVAKVNEASQQMMSSLRYARMIQMAILPDVDKIRTWLPGLVVWWAPREIVGGDFYYADRIQGGYVVAVADCTGRGVAGAFMTIIAGSELKRIVKGEGCIDPGEILARLNRRVRKALRQDIRRTGIDDGLNIGVCVVNETSRTLWYSGAKMDLIYTLDHEVYILKGDRKSVGYASVGDYGYSVQSMGIDRRISVYLCTDGITDQLGERSGQRFGTRRLKDLIAEHARLPISVQCEIIKASSEIHRGNRDQIDDMTLVAFDVAIT